MFLAAEMTTSSLFLPIYRTCHTLPFLALPRAACTGELSTGNWRRPFHALRRHSTTPTTTEDDRGHQHEKQTFRTRPDRRIGLTRDEQRQLVRKEPRQPHDPHILNVAIIGSPNAGKSTLANRLLGWKFAPVSEKVHTTRKKTLGILTEGNVQIVFLDTPGMIESAKLKKHNLESSLLVDPHSSLFAADIIVTLVDISTSWGRQRLDTEVLKALHFHREKKAILVLNKVDLLKPKKKLLQTTRLLTTGIVGGNRDSFRRKELEPQIDKESLFKKMVTVQGDEGLHDGDRLAEADGPVPQAEDELDRVTEETWRDYQRRLRAIQHHLYENDVKGWSHFDRVFMISAKHGEGLWDVKQYLLNEARPGNWEFSEELVTPESATELARQCVWEQCMNYLPKEIPYKVQIQIELWDIDEDDMLRTSFNIICDTSRHMAYVLGKDGETVKKIARGAKQALMDTFRRDLSFKLYVKLKGRELAL